MPADSLPAPIEESPCPPSPLPGRVPAEFVGAECPRRRARRDGGGGLAAVARLEAGLCRRPGGGLGGEDRRDGSVGGPDRRRRRHPDVRDHGPTPTGGEAGDEPRPRGDTGGRPRRAKPRRHRSRWLFPWADPGDRYARSAPREALKRLVPYRRLPGRHPQCQGGDRGACRPSLRPPPSLAAAGTGGEHGGGAHRVGFRGTARLQPLAGLLPARDRLSWPMRSGPKQRWWWFEGSLSGCRSAPCSDGSS